MNRGMISVILLATGATAMPGGSATPSSMSMEADASKVGDPQCAQDTHLLQVLAKLETKTALKNASVETNIKSGDGNVQLAKHEPQFAESEQARPETRATDTTSTNKLDRNKEKSMPPHSLTHSLTHLRTDSSYQRARLESEAMAAPYTERERRGVDNAEEEEDTKLLSDYGHPWWLSNCTNIYLDVGSNIGVQVRKLFEAEKYPDAPALELYDAVFGNPNGRRASASSGFLCALGMEPNPTHWPRLRQLQDAYISNGWRVHFYPFAAWKTESILEFEQTEDMKHHQWAARLTGSHGQVNQHIKNVRAVDLADFVSTLPIGSVKLMKMDIEGAEYETVARMIEKRSLCKDIISEAFIEAHWWGDTTTWGPSYGYGAILTRVANQRWCDKHGGPTKLNCMDDETYINDIDNRFGKPPFEPNQTTIHAWSIEELGTNFYCTQFLGKRE